LTFQTYIIKSSIHPHPFGSVGDCPALTPFFSSPGEVFPIDSFPPFSVPFSPLLCFFPPILLFFSGLTFFRPRDIFFTLPMVLLPKKREFSAIGVFGFFTPHLLVKAAGRPLPVDVGNWPILRSHHSQLPPFIVVLRMGLSLSPCCRSLVRPAF